MKSIFTALLTSMLLMLGSNALALNPAHANYAAQLASGVPSQIKQGGQGLANAGITDQAIIDIAVESIIQNAPKGKAFADPLRFVAKAVINAKNPRYYDAIMEVVGQKINRKLKKDLKKAAKSGGKPNGTEQYIKGSVDLVAIQAEAQKAQEELAKNLKAPEGYSSIAVVTVGMSSSELVAKCGQPTSTTSHMTGKQFIPFNFKGGDMVRTYYLYKGQGRVVVSSPNRYTTTTNVIEVIIDPSEVGYR
jgi:hypothetical protein